MFNSKKNNIKRKELFSDYFDNPTLSKKDNIKSFSVYIAKAVFDLFGEDRYLFVYVPRDTNAIGSLCRFNELNWVFFETRKFPTDEGPQCHSFRYTPKHTGLVRLKIKLKTRSDDKCVYVCESFPIRVELLVKPNGSRYDYPNSGTIGASIETYSTRIIVI